MGFIQTDKVQKFVDCNPDTTKTYAKQLLSKYWIAKIHPFRIRSSKTRSSCTSNRLKVLAPKEASRGRTARSWAPRRLRLPCSVTPMLVRAAGPCGRDPEIQRVVWNMN